MTENIDNDCIEKYKDLYLRSKEVLAEDLNRSYSIDTKASLFITVLTFLAGTYGFFFKNIFCNICQPANLIEWLLLINVTISFGLIVFAWFSILRILRQHCVLKVAFNDETIKFYDKNSLIDIYYATAKENKESIRKNRLVIDLKQSRLNFAYKLIMAIMVSFVSLALIYGCYTLLNCNKNHKLKKEVGIMAKEKDSTSKETQKIEPLKQQVPNPNVQAPKNEWITEGFDPNKSGKVEIKEVVVPVKPDEGKIEKGVIPKDKNK